MSLHRLSAGAGYQYLLRHTACGDVQRAATTPLTAYYTESGYPPGRWMGQGLSVLQLRPGQSVSEPHMALLYGEGRHPLDGSPLGRAYPRFKSVSDRVALQVKALPEDMGEVERADHLAQIQSREGGRPTPCAVAGFDLTFTVPKSASVLWALADAQVQEAIANAHQAALTAALGAFEDRALFTRTGSAGCAQVRTKGMVAAAFDHWDTRTGDPNLHTHVVVANKVQGEDGKWRSLDSRALHHAAVAVSELYDTVFPDELAKRLPVSWQWRDRGERRSPAFEVNGISDDLLSYFSTRSVQVDEAMTELMRQFHNNHGRTPNRVEVLQLRQRATRATRPPKSLQPLPELMARWRAQAQKRSGADAESTASQALRSADHAVSRGDISEAAVRKMADQTLEAVMQRRATWTPWNVMTEACRTTRSVRMTSTQQRQQLLDDVTAHVLSASLLLDPEEVVCLPAAYVRDDGTSVFTRAGERKYSHPRILDAEMRLLEANTTQEAPMVNGAVAARLARTPQHANGAVVHLAEDQVRAIESIATSGRTLEVLVGPAGAGKTTTLRAVRAAWETQYGRGSVLGLAPSSTAAHELAEALLIPCENTAKWAYETKGSGGERRRAQLAASSEPQSRGAHLKRAASLAEERRWTLHVNQLLIVDEASLAGTLALNDLREQAARAGAKLLLVGDHRQLSSVDAGGAFGLLAEKGNANELRSLWRFRHPWEAAATRRLRRGDADVLEEYWDKGRIRSGTAEVELEDAYFGWQEADRRDQTAILVAADGHSVEALNHRAHEDRMAAGLVERHGVSLGPDNQRGTAAVGDRILTRRNNRALTVPGRGHVRNGALWTVVAVAQDGGLLVTPVDRHVTHDCNPDPDVRVALPAAYVRDHVDLGYATTAHRAQGLTVDECHVLVSSSMTRETLYVAMTRGRSTNIAYVATDSIDPACDEIPDVHAVRTPRQILEQVLERSGSELSATQTREQLEREMMSPARLHPVRDTLVSDSDLLKWQPRLMALLPADVMSAVLESPARGALLAALRRAEALGLATETLQQEVLGARSLFGAKDVAAVLHERVERWMMEHPDGPAQIATPASEVEAAIAELDWLIAARLQQHTGQADNRHEEELWQLLLQSEPPMIER